MENKQPKNDPPAAADGSAPQTRQRTVKDLPTAERLYVDSVWVLSALFLLLCIWIIFLMFREELHIPISTDDLTILMELLAIVGMQFILEKTSITKKDLGLSVENFKKSALRALYRIPIQFAVFFIGKLVFLKIKPDFFPAGAPFWDWSQADMRLVKYLFTSLLQELLARGGVQETLTRVLPGKHSDILAIFMTSLFFMALHVQKGLFFMLGAGVLSFILGFVYRKDRSVFGVWLIHYFFGKLGDFLRFV